MPSKKQNVYLVCGGQYHDFDYVRLALLQKLAEYPDVRTRVAEDYSNLGALAETDALISYTANVIPSEAEQAALDDFLAQGKRWFALHGTNSAIEIDAKGYASSPRVAPRFMEMLGSQFIAHPPKGEFQVTNSKPEHPLVAGIDDFTVDDELYIIEQRGEIEVLLHTHYNGKAMRGFTEREFFSDEPRPIFYLRQWRGGEVLYLNLGHCRGHHDMAPLMDWYPEIERCAWEVPVFAELLNRGIDWTLQADDQS